MACTLVLGSFNYEKCTIQALLSFPFYQFLHSYLPSYLLYISIIYLSFILPSSTFPFIILHLLLSFSFLSFLAFLLTSLHHHLSLLFFSIFSFSFSLPSFLTNKPPVKLLCGFTYFFQLWMYVHGCKVNLCKGVCAYDF